jgi:hypothetical protein
VQVLEHVIVDLIWRKRENVQEWGGGGGVVKGKETVTCLVLRGVKRRCISGCLQL